MASAGLFLFWWSVKAILKTHFCFAQVSDAVAELATSVLENPGWPELLPYMFQCVQSNVPLQMECALLIFAQLAHYILETLRQYLGTLHGTLAQCLASPHSDVAVAAMRAATAFILVPPFFAKLRGSVLLKHGLHWYAWEQKDIIWRWKWSHYGFF